MFISYSRRDAEFVRTLEEHLTAAGKDVWIDLEDIPPSSEWLSEVYAGIEAAGSILLVISPNSISSEICNKEIEHALANGKRIIPLLWRDLSGAEQKNLNSKISSLNWIFFRATDDFDLSFRTLMKAIDTDLDWVHSHTRVLIRAREWEDEARDRSFLLRGRDLSEAERWLAGRGPDREPQPTSLHLEFILASRAAASRRQRVTVGATLIALLVVMTFAVLAWTQRQEAIHQRDEATRQRDTAVSRELAVSALSVLPEDPELSLLLALEGAKVKLTPQIEAALRRGLRDSHARAVIDSHSGPLYSAAFSPDGSTVVTAGEDGVTRLWDVATGDSAGVLESWQDGPTYDAAFSPDGKLLVSTGADGTARLWDVATGEPAADFNGSGAIRSAVFSPDGELLATAGAETRVWEVRSGRVVAKLNTRHFAFDVAPVNGDATNDVAFSPDERFLATIGGIPQIWDTGNWKRVAFVGGDEADLVFGPNIEHRSVAFSPNGRLVVTGSDDSTVRLWDAAGRGLPDPQRNPGSLATIGEHAGRVLSVAFSHDGKLVVSSGTDGTARIWDVTTGQIVESLRGHQGPVYSAVFSPDDRFVLTAGDDSTVRLWDVSANSGVSIEGDPSSFGPLRQAFNPDGTRVVTVGGDGIVRLWDVTTGRSGETLPEAPGRARDAAFLPTGDLLVKYSDGTARVWDVEARQVIRALAPGGDVLAVSPDGRMMLAGESGSPLRLWDLATADDAKVLREDAGQVVSAAFDPRGNLLATATTGFRPAMRSTEIWNASTGELVASLGGEESFWVLFSPDGKTLLTGGGFDSPDVRVWDAKTGARLAVLSGHSNPIEDADVSSDGSLLVTAGDGDETARIWSLQTLTGMSVLRDEGNVLAVDFSPNGRFVVTATGDGTVQVWEVASGESLGLFRAGGAFRVAFSPDGRYILVAEGNHRLILRCDVCASGQELVSLAQRRVTRPLTAAERTKYLSDLIDAA